jgi:hypothetical protein
LFVLAGLPALAAVLIHARAGGDPGAGSAPDPRSININGYRFDPFAGLPALPPGLRLERIPADRPSYHLVQLGGPITVEMRRGLEEAGAAILHYVPSNAYIVRADPGALARLWQLPAVRWSGPFEPAYALSRRLAREHDTVLTEAAERGLAGSAPRERVDTRVSVPVRVLAM